MKIKIKHFLLGIFFVASSINSMNHATKFFHSIKQLPDLQFKHTKHLGCLFGFAGIVKFYNVLQEKHLAFAYVQVHTECTHNPANTAEDFNVFRKAIKEYPNTYTNKQFAMFKGCMKDREHDLGQFNECKKAVDTLTTRTKKDAISFELEKYKK